MRKQFLKANKPFSFVINRTSGTETDGVCVAYKSV